MHSDYEEVSCCICTYSFMMNSFLTSLVVTALVRASLAAICDLDHQCPAGLVCRHVSYMPGTKACVYPNIFNTGSKRPGRCPGATLLGPILQPLAAACNSHQDCPLTKRCCTLTFDGQGACVDALPVDPSPTVTAVIVGGGSYGPVNIFIGGATLVQSNGYNVLVDTGSPRQSTELFKGLWDKGLTSEDIDVVVMSHGHPDHYANIGAFADTEQIWFIYTATGIKYTENPLAKNQTYYLNNDRNIEVVVTAGHTPQDVSVIVRNVPNYGTVAVVGDLFIDKDDGYDAFAADRATSDVNRKKVACMVDYIVPGHGVIFKVDAERKSKFGC